ncbi:hypothetical protein [Nocardia brasiliensis]|uniref:hypothetical protein n=1 Tax=Nocardia brasiliensis TaxID=37326 RepID=UPI00366F9EEF
MERKDFANSTAELAKLEHVKSARNSLSDEGWNRCFDNTLGEDRADETRAAPRRTRGVRRSR